MKAKVKAEVEVKVKAKVKIDANEFKNMIINNKMESTSYYKVIDGVKYDRALLESADTLIVGQGDGRISEADVRGLWESANDGKGVTDIERATLRYIYTNFVLTSTAEILLLKLLAGFDV